MVFPLNSVTECPSKTYSFPKRMVLELGYSLSHI